MSVPGDGRSGNDDAGTSNGGGGWSGGGVIPLGDSVREYGRAT